MPKLLETSDQNAEKLLMLSLALEQSIKDENWQEVDTLFSERDQIIGKFESAGWQLPTDTAQKIRQIDERIAVTLRGRSQEIVSRMRTGVKERKAQKVYKTPSNHLQSYDQRR